MSWLLVAVLSIAVVALSGTPAVAAAKLQVLPGGQVVVAQIAPSDSTVPVDGVLRGPDSQAEVTEVAWPYEADGYVANTGDRLVAFTVQLTEPTSDATGLTSTGPTLALVVDGSPQPLDTKAIFDSVGSSTANTPTGTGTESYVAAVPNDTTSVDLSMTDSGYTQSLSLWSLERTTTAPAVLYEDPTASGFTEQLGITKNLTIRDPSFGTNVSDVFIASAELSAFNPGSTDQLAPTNHAWLVLAMQASLTSGEENSNNYLVNLAALPGSAVALTSGTHHYSAQRSPLPQPNTSTADDGLLDATYAFLVPSTTTHGVVSIGPAVTSGQTYLDYLNSGATDSMTVSGPVRFSVGFPKPPAVQPQSTPPWVGEPKPATGLPGAGDGSSAGGFPILAALLVLAATVVVVLVSRRHRSGAAPEPKDEEHPVPVTSPPVPARPARAADRSLMRIELLGPVRITPLKSAATEFARGMLCYLAVHDDRPRSVDDTQTALWPTTLTETDVSRKTFLNHVSEVRRAVGSEHFPDNAKRAGYRLARVTTDWHEFRALADSAARERGPESRRIRAEALNLVRGVPFESEVSKWFQWADSEGLRTEMTRAIVTLAIDLHAACIHADDLEGAESALRQGLKACPTELSLWSCLADVVQARGDHGDLERFWRDSKATLDPAAIDLLEARVRG